MPRKRTRKEINAESNARKVEKGNILKLKLLEHIQACGIEVQSPDEVHLHPESTLTPGICLPYAWKTSNGYSIPPKNLFDLREDERNKLYEALEAGDLRADFNPNAITHSYKTQPHHEDYTKEWNWDTVNNKNVKSKAWRKEWMDKKWVDYESLDGEDLAHEQQKGVKMGECFVEHLGTGISFGRLIGSDLDEEDVKELKKNYGFEEHKD
ncbi:hypothetical protein BJ508DRAFT_316269 [Ascobolus immersus RN42]|uniref:Uncharacterized protein n=1 Tax=Ascobolus immersus RN42 TaxID=1160509 RepID=A0A3N4H731_ASCIM|nr:hypothetical protein BJ508DRAFT_316269 [Ascobolus immersus RN42]